MKRHIDVILTVEITDLEFGFHEWLVIVIGKLEIDFLELYLKSKNKKMKE